MSNNNLTEEEIATIRTRLGEYKLEHRDLDQIISSLSATAGVNQLQIRRLKKRKLKLKDMVSKLESLLIPDMDA
ncbi:MAG: DUF465 domain-containing protein [Gammaproteobacteria bacterium]|nr:DUF465 domain-containing protein [Gammaproteobacteria bacterium]